MGRRPAPRRPHPARPRRPRRRARAHADRRPLPRRVPLGRGRRPAGSRASRTSSSRPPCSSSSPARSATRSPAAGAAQRILEALERGNVFVVPLDPERTLVPLPPPLPQHAAAPARAARPGERRRPAPPGELVVRRARRRARRRRARARGRRHARRGGRAARSWLELYSGGEANALLDWIDRLPRDILADYPELALARGGVARAMGRIEEAEPWLRFAEQVADGRPRRAAAAGAARHRRPPAGDGPAGEGGRARRGRARPRGRRAPARRDRPRPARTPFFLGIALFWTEARAEAEALFRTTTSRGPRRASRTCAACSRWRCSRRRMPCAASWRTADG